MPNTPITIKAGGNISPSRFVMFDTSNDFTGLQATANARTIGVSQRGTRNAPISDVADSGYAAISGDTIQLYGPGDNGVLLELGDTVVRGGLLKADANGKGVPIATTGTTIQQIGARALQSGSSGERIQVEIIEYSERPALA